MTCPSASPTWKRHALESHLNDSCSIIEPGVESIGAGGGVVAGTPVTTTSIACRIKPLGNSGSLYEIAMRLQLKAPFVFYFATSQVISNLAEMRATSNARYIVSYVQPIVAQSVLLVVLADKVS